MDTPDNDAPPPVNPVWTYTGPDTLTITCTRRVQIGPTDPNAITEFTVSEPTIEQMAAFEDTRLKTRNEFEAGAVLIHRNSGISLPHAKRISIRDFRTALDFIMGFMPPLPEDGAS